MRSYITHNADHAFFKGSREGQVVVEFMTPQKLASRLVSHLPDATGDGAYVLEPSAGSGNIVRALIERYGVHRVKAVEQCPEMAAELERSLLPAAVITGDFCPARRSATRGAAVEVLKEWGRPTHVVMNPPFHEMGAANHIHAAASIMRAGGTLVSIVPAELRHSTDGHHKAAMLAFYRDFERVLFYDLPHDTFSIHGVKVPVSILVARWRTKESAWVYQP